jgi:hypothetical protein
LVISLGTPASLWWSGHLASTFVADAIQNAMGTLGIVEPSNVVGIHDTQPA